MAFFNPSNTTRIPRPSAPSISSPETESQTTRERRLPKPHHVMNRSEESPRTNSPSEPWVSVRPKTPKEHTQDVKERLGYQDEDYERAQTQTKHKKTQHPRRTTRRQRKETLSKPEIQPLSQEAFMAQLSRSRVHIEQEPTSQPNKPLYTKADAYNAAGALLGGALHTQAHTMARDYGATLHPTANPHSESVFSRAFRSYQSAKEYFSSPPPSQAQPEEQALEDKNRTPQRASLGIPEPEALAQQASSGETEQNTQNEASSSATRSLTPNIGTLVSGLVASTSRSLSGRMLGLFGIIASQASQSEALPIPKETKTKTKLQSGSKPEHAEFIKLKKRLEEKGIKIPTEFEHELLHLLAQNHGNYADLDMHKVVAAAAELEHRQLKKHPSHHPQTHQDQKDRHKQPKPINRDTLFHEHAQRHPVKFHPDVHDSMHHVLGVPESEHPHADMSSLCGLDQMLNNRQMMVSMLQDTMKSIEDLIKAGKMTKEQDKLFRYRFLNQIREKIKTDEPNAWADFLLGLSTGASEGPSGGILLDISVRDIEDGRIFSSLSAQEIQGYIVGSKAWRALTGLFTEVMYFSALTELANTIAHNRADLCTYIRTLTLISMASTPGEEGILEKEDIPDLTEQKSDFVLKDLEEAKRKLAEDIPTENKKKAIEVSSHIMKSRLEALAKNKEKMDSSDSFFKYKENTPTISISLRPEFNVNNERLSSHQHNILEAIRRGDEEQSGKRYQDCFDLGLTPEETLLVLMEHSNMSDSIKHTQLEMNPLEYKSLYEKIRRENPVLLKNKYRKIISHLDAFLISTKLMDMKKFDMHVELIEQTMYLCNTSHLGKTQSEVYLAHVLEFNSKERTTLTGLSDSQFAIKLKKLQEQHPILFKKEHLYNLRCKRTLGSCLTNKDADQEQDSNDPSASVPEKKVHPVEPEIKQDEASPPSPARIEKTALIQHITSRFERLSIGIPIEHAIKMQEVAWTTNSVFGVRPVDSGVKTLIQEGYPTKDIRVKGKSSNWGPQNGFICVEQGFSKKEGNAATVETQNAAIQTGLSQGHFTQTPLKISITRILELEESGCIEILNTDTERKMTLKAKANHSGQSGETYTFIAKPDSEHSEQHIIYHQYTNTDGETIQNPLHVLADTKSGEPLTADYDLFFVAGSITNFGTRDQRTLSQARLNFPEVGDTASNQGKEVNSSPKKESSLSQTKRRSYSVDMISRFNTNQGKPLGVISTRVKGLIAQINLALDRGRYKEMVHHGEDAGNPYSDIADNFPATFYLPRKMEGTYKGKSVTLESISVVKNIFEYQQMVSVIKENNFHFTDNPNWPKTTRPSFAAARNRFNN